MGRRWRAWSPWRLREALRWQRDMLQEKRTTLASATDVEQWYRHATAALDGHPDPWESAKRYTVEGRTLIIDATPHGTRWEQVVDQSQRCGSPMCSDPHKHEGPHTCQSATLSGRKGEETP